MQVSIQPTLLKQFNSRLKPRRNYIFSSERKHSHNNASNLRPQLTNSTPRSMDLAQEKRCIQQVDNENGFTLHKSAFRDAIVITLRYGWLLSNLPSTCTCGASLQSNMPSLVPFEVSHHNEIRDLTANLMAEFCHSVVQPITGEIFATKSANRKMVPSQISQLMVFGVGDSKGHFWMPEFSITVLPPTMPPP